MARSAAVYLVSDDRFRDHRAPEGHPECPERLDDVKRGIDCAVAKGLAPISLPTRAATTAELERAHTPEHIERVRRACQSGANLDPDTYTSIDSEATARHAAGSCIALAESVLGEEGPRAGFAAVRPPGHHAERRRTKGFCLYSNVAIAALGVLERGLAERVAIVDWDVHHGNGTEDILKGDGRALYVSLHQFPFYPGSGHISYVGEGAGLGWTVNLPCPAGCRGSEYLYLYDSIILPILEECDPDLIVVSAGFDTHRLDPLAMMRHESSVFGAMTRRLSKLGKPIACVLEGGYDPTALCEGVEEVLLALGGLESDRQEREEPPGQLAALIAGRSKEVLAPYWSCMRC